MELSAIAGALSLGTGLLLIVFAVCQPGRRLLWSSLGVFYGLAGVLFLTNLTSVFLVLALLVVLSGGVELIGIGLSIRFLLERSLPRTENCLLLSFLVLNAVFLSLASCEFRAMLQWLSTR